MRAVIVFVAAALSLSGCTVGPDYRKPETRLPESFTVASASEEIATWWQALKDKELDSLITRAVSNNYDVEIALTRVEETRTIEAVLTGESLPSVELSGAAARGTGTNSTKGRVSGPLNAGTNTTGLHEITHVFGVDAFYDLDFFGRYRREIEAAKADTAAAIETRNTVLVTVVGDVARAYIELRGLQTRLQVAERNVETARQTVGVVQTRLDRGLTNELDLTLAQRQLATQQAVLAPLSAGAAAATHRIAVLLGLNPEELAPELTPQASIPPVPGQIRAGLPLELLERRPEIRLAERQLAAATARIGVATADLFPRVALTAGLGAQGQAFGRSPVVPVSFIGSIGPQIYWPLLDFGTLDALIEIQDLRTHEEFVSYKQTIIKAVAEVDDALENFTAEEDRLNRLSEALIAGKRAVALASERYDRGLTDFLNVLDAQRQEYELEDQYASSRQAVATAYVALYQALGGGWQNYQSLPPIHRPEPALLATFHRLGSAPQLP
ncbi:MAG TPA: efflux transporter outer membrane subunit [Stellaceae bacterium]|nr:efflux transporter outer membrane subunit [Stellaceae bacterium]